MYLNCTQHSVGRFVRSSSDARTTQNLFVLGSTSEDVLMHFQLTDKEIRALHTVKRLVREVYSRVRLHGDTEPELERASDTWKLAYRSVVAGGSNDPTSGHHRDKNNAAAKRNFVAQEALTQRKK